MFLSGVEGCDSENKSVVWFWFPLEHYLRGIEDLLYRRFIIPTDSFSGLKQILYKCLAVF